MAIGAGIAAGGVLTRALPWLIVLMNASDTFNVWYAKQGKGLGGPDKWVGPGGEVYWEGATVRVVSGDTQITLPFDEAYQLSRGSDPARTSVYSGNVAPKPSPAREKAVYWLGESQVAQLERQGAIGVLRNPTPGDPQQTVAPGPDPDSKPFTAREYLLMTNLAIQQGQVRKQVHERELEVLRQTFQARIAAAADELTRERLRQELVVQERELQSRAALQSERLAADAAAQSRLFAQQIRLLDREQAYKSTEAAVDRAWRERTSKEASEIADYRKNLAADLAVTRSLDAARRLRALLGEKASSTFVSFASRFAGS